MDIFESLENLEVSEECFNNIMDIVEEILSEDIHSAIDTYADDYKKGRLHQKADEVQDKYEDDVDNREGGKASFEQWHRRYGADTKNREGEKKTLHRSHEANLKRHGEWPYDKENVKLYK
jgi:hypothetical protein